jgi:hypothetical protein
MIAICLAVGNKNLQRSRNFLPPTVAEHQIQSFALAVRFSHAASGSEELQVFGVFLIPLAAHKI